MKKWPEYEKMLKLEDLVQPLLEFLDWSEEEGMSLCRLEEGSYKRISENKRSLLVKFFDIDMDKLEKEKQEMLDDLHKISGRPKTINR